MNPGEALALARLTAAVTRSAELFEQANQHLAEQLGYDGETVPQLEHEETNGKAKRKVKQ